MAKTKCVVIREELVALTGDYKKAIVLGQMLYWSERVRDRALYREEECSRLTCDDQNNTYNHGWFYKRAEDLAEETMMGVKPKAMRDYVKHLVEHGWLLERRNPIDKMDRTLHYRVDRVKVENDLAEIGYVMDGCEMESSAPTSPNEDTYFPKENGNVSKEPSNFPNRPSHFPKALSKQHKETSARGEKENTSTPKPLEPQGFQATEFVTEIKKTKIKKTKIKKTEITRQQQSVRDRIMNLFDQQLSEHQVHKLIYLAEAKGVDILEVIDNTYHYHTRVQHCRNLFGALHYAIQNGGWEVQGVIKHSYQKPSPPLPKAVQAQLEGKFDYLDIPPEELEEKRNQLREKMKLLGYLFDENGQAYRPENAVSV